MGPKKDVALTEKETPFSTVPYETLDVCTSITLLAGPEEDVIIRALNVLSKYADTADYNVTYLYKNGLLAKLLAITTHLNVVIVRFSLKLIGRLVTTEAQAKQELLLEQNLPRILEINQTFMTNKDLVVQEYCTLILGKVVTEITLASILLGTGVTAIIFIVLETSRDPDIQYNALEYLNNLLNAEEAKDVIPGTVEFHARTILCYLKSKMEEIRDVALDIVQTLTLWQCDVMQEILKEFHIVETLFDIIFTKEYKAMHKKAFSIILTCTKCPETSSYYVRSEQFVQFCDWAKLCPGKYIIPSATIFEYLTSIPKLKQVLFDFAVEDTILSFFRTTNEVVFYKTCSAIINMSSHRYCAQKILTPTVLNRLIWMLGQLRIPTIPYHEIALKTIYTFMKRNETALSLMIVYQGAEAVMDSFLKGKDEFTAEGFIYLMDILYIFSTNEKLRERLVHRDVYQILLDTFDDEPYELSGKALLILNQFVENSECRQYFIELNGVQKIYNKIKATPHESLFKNIIIFIQRLFVYKRMAMVFLWGGGVKVLKQICEEVKHEIPQINQTINMLYDLYLPLKFHELNRLEVTDHFDSRFYLVNTDWKHDFPYLELLIHQQVCLTCVMYLVDFRADVSEMLQNVSRVPTAILDAGVIKKAPPIVRKPSIGTAKGRYSNQSEVSRRSILKRRSTSKSQKTVTSSFSNIEIQTSSYMVWNTKPPPINYGGITEDPYLPRYVDILQSRIFSKEDCLCFRHQVSAVACFVSDVLSGPVDDGSLITSALEVHLSSLKYKLGTTLIPLGYLRCGDCCEKALLFKAVAEKVHIPTRLIRRKLKGTSNFIYWNEVPLISEETCSDKQEDQNIYMAYVVVDLMKDVGHLMLVGSQEANLYCGLT